MPVVYKFCRTPLRGHLRVKVDAKDYISSIFFFHFYWRLHEEEHKVSLSLETVQP